MITDGQIHRVLAELREGESIDAEGMARYFGLPHLDVSLAYRLAHMVETGFAAYDGNTRRWYVAGPELKKMLQKEGE